MKTSRWINIGTNLAAVITAIVALLTLAQMRVQTRNTYLPDLVVSSSRSILTFTFEDPVIQAEQMKWMSQSEQDTTGRETVRLHLELINIGMGAAREITVDQSFDMEKLLGNVNVKGKEFQTEVEYSKESSGIFLMNTFRMHYTNSELEYLVPITQSEAPNHLPLNDSYLTLYSNLLAKMINQGRDMEEKSENIKAFFEYAPHLEMKITYKDIALDNRTTKYLVKLIPTHIDLTKREVIMSLSAKSVSSFDQYSKEERKYIVIKDLSGFIIEHAVF